MSLSRIRMTKKKRKKEDQSNHLDPIHQRCWRLQRPCLRNMRTTKERGKTQTNPFSILDGCSCHLISHTFFLCIGQKVHLCKSNYYLYFLSCYRLLRAFDWCCRTCAMLSLQFHLQYWFNKNEEVTNNNRTSFNYFVVSLLYNKSIVRKEEEIMSGVATEHVVILLTEKCFLFLFSFRSFCWFLRDRQQRPHNRVKTKCSSEKVWHHATRHWSDQTLDLLFFENSVFLFKCWSADWCWFLWSSWLWRWRLVWQE